MVYDDDGDDGGGRAKTPLKVNLHKSANGC